MATNRKAEAKRAGTRTRNWTCIVYPESAPENWRDIIDEEHIAWIESPLHDSDINATGEAKKAHWHILLLYEGPKTFEQVSKLTEKINAPIPQMASSAKGTVRYMAHIDNPEKAQYKLSEIVAHGGADIEGLLTPTSSQRYEIICEMMNFVDDNNIRHYIDLVQYAREERRHDWFPVICDNATFVIREYIKSNWQKNIEQANDN